MTTSSGERPLRDPFALTPDPDVYVPRPATEEVREELLRSVRNASISTALVGPSGLGKSLMLQLLVAQSREEFRAVYLPYAALPPKTLCAWALNVLGFADTKDPVDSMHLLLSRLQEQDSPLLMVIDDASEMPAETARWLGDLAKSFEGTLRLLIAVSDDATIRTLGAIGADFDLVRLSEPMSETETARYIDARLTRARVPPATRERFDRATLRELHNISGGNPRRLHTAAAGALERGGRRGWVELDPVFEELLRRQRSDTDNPAAAQEAAESDATNETPIDAGAPVSADAAVLNESRAEAFATPSTRPLLRVEPLPSRLSVALGILLVASLTVSIPLIRSLLPPTPLTRAAEVAVDVDPVGNEARSEAIALTKATDPVEPDGGAAIGNPVDIGPFPVHVNATPWANVKVDGIDLGATPIANIPLLAGSHTFVAQLPDGRVIERIVEIDAEHRHVAFE